MFNLWYNKKIIETSELDEIYSNLCYTPGEVRVYDRDGAGIAVQFWLKDKQKKRHFLMGSTLSKRETIELGEQIAIRYK